MTGLDHIPSHSLIAVRPSFEWDTEQRAARQESIPLARLTGAVAVQLSLRNSPG